MYSYLYVRTYVLTYVRTYLCTDRQYSQSSQYENKRTRNNGWNSFSKNNRHHHRIHRCDVVYRYCILCQRNLSLARCERSHHSITDLLSYFLVSSSANHHKLYHRNPFNFNFCMLTILTPRPLAIVNHA